ncbi:ead/Ea22-like family protein [Enterobacter sp.]|uniref:ead/Ea22-like family protein n=1 Tax=Enterobacter sp. TaxID=42895 RepID=UPI00296F4764|nr:ead/Ea22-like family protein [Enterobacter sp.]
MSNMNELAAKLKAAAQEEIMCREAYDTSDAWHDAASPENVLALVETLEAAEKRIADLESHPGAVDRPAVWVRYGDRNHAPDCTLDYDEAREWGARGLEVVRMVAPVPEARTLTVNMPEYRNSPDMHTKQFYEAIGFNQGLDACIEAILAAGIKLQIEGEE